MSQVSEQTDVLHSWMASEYFSNAFHYYFTDEHLGSLPFSTTRQFLWNCFTAANILVRKVSIPTKVTAVRENLFVILTHSDSCIGQQINLCY